MNTVWHVMLKGRRGAVCQCSSFNVLAKNEARAVGVAKLHSLLREPINAIVRPANRLDFSAFPAQDPGSTRRRA